MLKFYGYKKCGTCRKAEKALDQLGVRYQFIDITENPPGVDTLRTIVEQAGAGYRKLFNTSGIQYRALNIKEKLPAMNAEEVARTLAGNGRLIKRPLITDGRYTTVGFREGEFQNFWRGAP